MKLSRLRTPTSANCLYRRSISCIAQRNEDKILSVSTMTGVNKCGIPLYPIISTRLGSIRIRRTSAGVVRNSKLQIQALRSTDLPDPVVPAINTCGIFAISPTSGFPDTSNPNATANLLFAFTNASERSIFLRVTNSRPRFGISSPTKSRPGIGASIRTCPVGAARARAKSLVREVIFETFVPSAILIEYWVTAGPGFTSTTFACIPKLSRVFSITFTFSFILPRSALSPGPSDNSDNVGNSHNFISWDSASG